MARVTVEDCLGNVENRFQLVLVATRRARQIMLGSTPLVPEQGDKPVLIALREIAAGKVGPDILNEPLPEPEVRGPHDLFREPANYARDDDDLDGGLGGEDGDDENNGDEDGDDDKDDGDEFEENGDEDDG